MPRRVDLTRAVQQFVQSEVASVLDTYRNALDRVANFVSEARANVDRRRARNLATGTARPFGQPGRRRAAANGALHVGQLVRYRQGAGTFEAKVVEIDPAGPVTLERRSDGKRVTRPAGKLIVA